MKTKQNLIKIARLGVLLFLLALPTVVQAQFTYITNNGTLTITGDPGASGVVTISHIYNSPVH